MVELEQLNIHSSRDIIARHGLTLPGLFDLSLEFYKEEKHQFNLSYDQKNQLAAYWRQSTLGPFHPDKLNPGYFDFVGNDRKKAWEALGDISANGAMAGFCNLLETVCPDLVPWIRHKKRERENKIKYEKLKEEARKIKEAEENMEASRLINIVKKADQLKKQSVDDDSSEDEEMPTLEKNDRKIIYAAPAETSEPAISEVEQPLQNGVNYDSLGEVEPTNYPELLLPEQINGNVEEVVSNVKTGSVDHNLEKSSDTAVEEPVRTEHGAPQTVDFTTANESINDSQVTAETSNDARVTASETATPAVSPDSLNTVLTQHFACILYLKQMKEAGHALSVEQENYLSQMSAYEEQLKLLKTNIVPAKGTQEITSVQESGTVHDAVQTTASDLTQQQSDTQNEGVPTEGAGNVENADYAALESIPNSQESFSVLNSEDSLQIIQSEEVVKDAEPVGTVVDNAETILAAEVTATSQVETNPEVEKRAKEEVATVGAPKVEPLALTATEVPQEAPVRPEQAGILNDLESSPQESADGVDPEVTDIEEEIAFIQESPEQADLGAPANATELSALAETLQKQLPDTPNENYIANDGEGSECESESDVKMWSKSGVDLFIAEVSQDADSVLHVGRGETVTVRIPTYESGTALYWEFATQNYDIGFGASFEWEEEVPTAENPLSVTSPSGPRDVTLRVRREPILPILRRSSHEKVITGSHAFPRGGTYLLMFDNSYSLLRSKTVYYRVFYTR